MSPQFSTQAVSFWQFFGPVLASLRFKRNINPLWLSGYESIHFFNELTNPASSLILGFASKETCNALLANRDIGTFIIRFSESTPGLFSIAYISDDPFDRVKHYLVKPEDLSLNKTLPDLLREKPQFQHLLQLDVPTGALRCYPKDAVFTSYYSKNRKVPATTGGSTGYVTL